MSSHRCDFGSIILLAASLGLCLAGCGSNDVPTGIPSNDPPAAEVLAALTFGPFPGKTTIFVDVDNTTGLEDGSQSRPFNSIRDALAVAKSGDIVGVAPGVYAETFPRGGPNYVINGLKNFALAGSGPQRTTIRGDRSFSLIRVQGGASAVIRGFTIEHGGQTLSEGGGIQVLGSPDSVTLTVSNVILRDNEATNGAAIEAEGRASLRLFNVLIAQNRSNNCCSVLLRGQRVHATFKHTTITQNAAAFLAGGVVLEGSSRLDLVNSIVWGNTLADAATSSDGAHLIAAFSDVGGGLLPGRGNLSVDPRFVDPGNQDFRLRLDSPAVDAGNNLRGLSTDLFGHPRPVDGDGDGVAVTDMGAFERLATP